MRRLLMASGWAEGEGGGKAKGGGEGEGEIAGAQVMVRVVCDSPEVLEAGCQGLA